LSTQPILKLKLTVGVVTAENIGKKVAELKPIGVIKG